MTDDAHARVLGLLQREGWNATSFQVLETGFQYWWEGTEACVAYMDTGRAWVAAGAPIAPAERIGDVAARFVAAARAHGRRACFFAAEARFAHAPGQCPVLVGEQPVWDPADWEATLRSSKSLREQLRRARAKGVTVRAVDGAVLRDPDAPVRRAIEGLVARWLAGRSMAPMGFLVGVQVFDHPTERRYHVAERHGRVVGFLAAVPVYGRQGWFFEDLLRDGEAPNGTAELLVDAGMRGAADEGSRYVTLGLAPLSGSVGRWLRAIRDRAAGLYDFRGVHAFKARLRPRAWDPVYLVHPPETSATVALYDVLGAFARGSFTRFGIETLLRGPAVVVRVLAALLMPWTLALALAAARWFPAPWVRWGWVLFDATATVALFALAYRWRRSLGVGLALAVTLDAALTLLEALVWNLPRLRSILDAVVVAAACFAPTLAAAVLWGAVRRRARLDATVGSHRAKVT